MVATQRQIYLFGGHNGTRSLNLAMKLDVLTGSWSHLPNPLPVYKNNAACALVRSQRTGKESVVVAGGHTNTPVDTVHILDLDTLAWRAGANLPVTISAGASVPHDDRLFIAGGNSATRRNLNTLYRYDVDANSWNLLPERLSKGRWEAAAFTVSRDAFPACN